MEIYPMLTKLLMITHEIEELENQKRINYPEKEKQMKKFVDILKSLLTCKVKSEESRNFRLYFIEYLADLISSSMSFCSCNEKNEIENSIKLIRQKKDNNTVIGVNFNDNNNGHHLESSDIQNKNSGNYELLPNNEDNCDNNKFPVIKNNLLLLNIKDEIGFYPKNYKLNNENSNKIHYQNLDKKVNNIINDNLINSDSNEIKDDGKYSNSNKFEHHNHNDNDNFDEDENIFSDIENNNIENKKNALSNDKINNEKNKMNLDKNNSNKIQENNLNYLNKFHNHNNINNNNINNNINSNKNISNIDRDMHLNGFINKDINNNAKDKNNEYHKEEKKETLFNEKDKNNDIIEEDDNNLNHQNKYSKDNNNEIYNNKIKKENKNAKQSKEQNNNNKNFRNPAQKYQEKIEEYYRKLFNNNIAQNFINSILNNNSNFNQICTKFFNLVKNNQREWIEQIYKEKLMTIISILYYFSKGQKEKIDEYFFKTDSDIDKQLCQYLNSNILLSNSSEYVELNQKKASKAVNNFCNDLFLNTKSDGKKVIFAMYSFLVISRCLRNCCKENDKYFFDKLLEKEYLVSFKIHFILKHQEFYKYISDDFIQIYHGLKFIYVFYNEIFCESQKDIRIMKDEITGKYIFGKDKFILSFDSNCDFDIEILFSKNDNNIYREVMEKIQHFYSINQFNSNDINDLIYYSSSKIANKESNFILNVVEHVCEKKFYIFYNFEKYKNNLKILEKQIFELGKNTLNLKKVKEKIENYSISIPYKLVFDNLLEKIKENVNKEYKDKFSLYPYGSITQFLGGSKSDIDIYLDITQMRNVNEKISFLFNLRDTIETKIKSKLNLVISTRLCVFQFKYSCFNGRKTDFDISLMGFCPYLHSILFRSYSLMEPRFPLVAIALKTFVKKIGIKSLDNKGDFLNSFSWMVLLVSFLQDIIKPPILPKILSDKDNSIKTVQIQYGNNKNRNKFLGSFVESIKYENTFLPDSLFDAKALNEIYKKQINNNEKKPLDNLSCAEILLNFLEFIIYYFKNDSVYVNCSIENEGYESMYYILNNNDPDKNEKKKIDERFQEYFKNKYFKCKKYNE